MAPRTFLVQWEIEVDAESPREAAELALEIMHDPSSDATCFDVRARDADPEEGFETIDLGKEEEEG